MHEADAFICFVRSALTGRAYMPRDLGECDMRVLYHAAAAQDMANICAYGMQLCGLEADGEYGEKFAQARKTGAIRYAVQDAEAQTLSEELEKAGIYNMVMKGSVIRHIYPIRDMRTSADIDILTLPRDAQAVRSVMQRQGYVLAEEGETVDVYKKKPFLSVEIHNALDIGEKSTLPPVLRDNSAYIPIEGCRFTYRMTDEDAYIYMIWHTAKHMNASGAGLRHFTDIYLYNKYYKELDRAYINSQLSDVGLLRFCECAEHLCRYLFDGEEERGYSRELTRYILGAGVFGTAGNAAAVSAVKNKGKRKSPVAMFFCRLFPGLREMKLRYRALEKHPYLLPYYWVVRIFTKGGGTRAKLSEISSASNISDDRISGVKKLMNDIGLEIEEL